MSDTSFGHGRQSDSIDGDDREAQHAALKRLMKPTNRAKVEHSRLGDGAVCPTNPEHGKMFHMPSGNDYCPHSDHTAKVQVAYVAR